LKPSSLLAITAQPCSGPTSCFHKGGQIEQ
jgi:hypothetical protein